MQLAKLAPATARRLGLSSNHHARVWCSCMDHPLHKPGNWSERGEEHARNDPRRLGAYDHLGVIDLRVANSGLALWRHHVGGSP
jgi:hypothetical protein